MIRARLPRYKTDPRSTCIRARIANDICIRVRITGIRVRIAMRGCIAEVVLGCSGHYIDPTCDTKTGCGARRPLHRARHLERDGSI